MAQRGQFYLVRSDPDTDFTEAIAQGAAEFEQLLMVPAIGVGGPARALVRSIQIASVENLAWELWFFDSETTLIPSDVEDNRLRGRWAFQAADGERIGAPAAGPYMYTIDGLDIPYEDEDYILHEKGKTNRLHVALVNRSAASKTAGAGGAIMVQFVLEETMGW